MARKPILGISVLTILAAACGSGDDGATRPFLGAGGSTDDASFDESSASGGSADGGGAGSSTVDAALETTGPDAAPDAGCAEAQCCAVMIGVVDRTSTGGNYVLEFGDLYFEVSRAGGKVVTFRRASGSNLLTGPTVNTIYFGSSFWASPQFPPADEIDKNAFPTATTTDISVTMTSDVATTGPKVRVTKAFTANLCEHAVDIDYAIENADTSSVSLAAWEVTRVAPGGLAFFGKGSVYPDSAFKVGVEIVDQAGYYWYDQAAHPHPNDKLKADATPGWLAFTNGTELFVKEWTDVSPSDRVPNEAEVEIWDATDKSQYIELETQGPYGAIASGATTHFKMRWTLQALVGHRTVGDSDLIAAVTQIVQ